MTLYGTQAQNHKNLRTKAALVIAWCCLCAESLLAGVITGTVFDDKTGEPIPFATIRVERTGRSMLANENGQYRLRLENGTYRLKVSHVAHYSEYLQVQVADSAITLDVTLREAIIVVRGTRVYGKEYDPAQKIIVRAIAAKEDILSRIQRYEFDAYTRFLVLDKSKDDSSSVALLTETQLQCFWEQPDKYKEVITARRQTANIKAENNLVAIGEILNFNRNRLDLGSYSVVSPTARDALDYYNYYLLDTIFMDDQPVFRLEIEPKNQNAPLFIGTIDIADSTFAVVGVEVGFSAGVETPYVSDFRYGQRYAELQDSCWMPIEIRFSADVDLPIPGLPVYSVDYVAALHNYVFDIELPRGVFDYVLEVAGDADDLDSATWDSGQMIPLTPLQLRGYKRQDSIANAPKPIHKKILSGTTRLLIESLSNYDFFHFNRVEGAYLGLGRRFYNPISNTQLDLKAGYAFDGKYWQARAGITRRLWTRKRLDVTAEYHDEIRRRPTIISRPGYNPMLLAVTNKTDPFDYYSEKGFRLALGVDPVNQLRFRLSYQDYRQHSESNNTEYSIFREHKRHRPNPAITDGKLRSLAASLTYDSQKLMKLKDREIRSGRIPHIILETGVETASPRMIDNDFDFVRYYVLLTRLQRTLGMGLTYLRLYAGASDDILPPQRYFTVDFGDELFSSELNFKTLGETNFAGSRAVSAYASHDFGSRLFRNTGLPLVRDIPLSLGVHGGAFWTDFKNHPEPPGDDLVRKAKKVYGEIGFSIRRIPFMNLRTYFTWQLSDYDTNRFAFSLGLGF